MAAARSSQDPAAKEHHDPHAPALHHHSPRFRKLLHATRALHTYLTMLAIGPLMFVAVTGFMLTHDEWFGADDEPTATTETTVPPNLLAARDKLALVEYLRCKAAIIGAVKPFDWPDADDSVDEPICLTFASPRRQTEVEVFLSDGRASITCETAAVNTFLTNLHKGKHAGAAWRVLLDATAVLLIFASLSGALLWWSMPRRRKLGLIAMVAAATTILALYFATVP